MFTFRLIPLRPLMFLAFACFVATPAAAQKKNTAAASNTSNQAKALTQERDALKQELDELRQEYAELSRQLDEANAQREQAVAARDQLETTLRENQSGGQSLLKELQQTKNDLRNSNNRVESLEKEIASLRTKVDDAANPRGGALVQLGPDILPAKCLNLRRMTPSVKRVSGVVVVNCLINELGEPVDVRLIQGLPGDETEWVLKAHEACLEAAKRLAFEPATTLDGSVRLKIWQGVGFLLN